MHVYVYAVTYSDSTLSLDTLGTLWTCWALCTNKKSNHNNIHVHVNDNQCEINSSYKSKKAFKTFLTNKRIYAA